MGAGGPAFPTMEGDKVPKGYAETAWHPDDDNRPFNVAYAAATQSRKLRDQPGPSLEDSPPRHHDATREGHLRDTRPVSAFIGGHSLHRSADHQWSSLTDTLSPSVSHHHAASRPIHSQVDDSAAIGNSTARSSRPIGVRFRSDSQPSNGKHALEDDADSDYETSAKKSRIEREEPASGDDVEWQGSQPDMDVDEAQPAQRGAKRVASSHEDDSSPRTERRDKRARKTSVDNSGRSADEGMNEDEDEELLENATRGKKRDRAEADSAFGGDDSLVEDDDKPQRRRRRRTVPSTEPSSNRGQKRSRGVESVESDGSGSERPARRGGPKKRGKRSQTGAHSNDPLCKGRRIGEEWESHGILFKVGPNGQRLRQALVKKSKSRFSMPSDSQHPDRRANVEIYVETWLTDEEYKTSKERHELDISPTPPEIQTPVDHLESPSIAGKNLLWSSTASRDGTSKRPFRQSLTGNVDPKPSPTISVRRVSAVYDAPESPATESPQIQKTKSYTKWEKQELEAAAMLRIRERLQAAKNASVPTPTSMPAPSPFIGTTPSTGTPSTTKTSESAPATTSNPFAFGIPTSSKPAGAEPSKPPTSSVDFAKAPANPFAAPLKAPGPAATSSAPTPSVPQSSGAVPSFFSKPAAPTPAASAAPAALPPVNPFAPKSTEAKPADPPKPASSTAPTGTTSKPTSQSPFGAPNASAADGQKPGTSLLSRLGMGPPPAQPSVPSVPASSTFPFGKPAASAPAVSTPAAPEVKPTTTTPAGAPAPTLKFNFGAPKQSTPAPAPAVAAAAPAPPAASTATPSFFGPVGGAPKQEVPGLNIFGAAKNADSAAAQKSPFGGFGSSAATPNPFGAPTSTAAGTNGSTKPAEAPKSVFGGSATTNTGATSSPFGGASSPSPFGVTAAPTASPFGATSSSTASPFGAATKPTSVFGSTTQPSAFGAGATTTSPFGAPSKPTETPKSSLFGAATSTPSPFSSGAPKQEEKKDGDAPKPLFSFGAPSSTTTTTTTPAFGATSKPVFGSTTTPITTPTFGSGTAATTTPAFGSGSFATATPAFGAATTSAFGGGSKPASAFGAAPASGSTFAFGQVSAPTAFGASSTPNPIATGSPFGAPSNPAATGESKPTFSFGTPATNGTPAPAAQPATSNPTFSFGAPSGVGRVHDASPLKPAEQHAPPPAAPGQGPQIELAQLCDNPAAAAVRRRRCADGAGEEDGIGLPGTPGLDDWMNEKSHEELSGLLLKADGIIKSRETGAPSSSSRRSSDVLNASGGPPACSLYSDNLTLKTKHEALLARLPSTKSPQISRPSSPLLLEPPSLHQSPSLGAVAFPASPDSSGGHNPFAALRRRARRISVTPAELALLSDQNAELINKLEDLEAESQKADHAGKRKLRKLEQEIQDLRDELERSQARGVELEEQARAAASAAAAERRREEREARLLALKDRATGVAASESLPEGFRDFAPPSSLSRRSSPFKRSASGSSSSFTESASEPSFEQELSLAGPEDEEPNESDPYFPTGQTSLCAFRVCYCFAATLKIRELEETNAQIHEQQKITEERMRSAQWDAESIRRVYDCLDEGDVDLEIQEEEGPRTFGTAPCQWWAPSASAACGESTLREGAKGHTGPKSRKTLVGLFDASPDNSLSSSSWGRYPPSLKVSPSFRTESSLDNTPAWSCSATDGLAFPSPPVSSMHVPLDGLGRTLGSELGSEFGDDWAERGINHHLRASSLCDIAGLSTSVPASPSESTMPLPPIAFPTVDEHPDEWDEEQLTPPRTPQLQLTVQPPTPTPDKVLRSSPATIRQIRLSQTTTLRNVNNRQAGWNKRELEHARAFKTDHSGLLGETFDHAVGQIKRVASRSRFSPLGFALSDTTLQLEDERKSSGLPHADADESTESTASTRSTTARPIRRQHDGVVGFVLEAWLWLQFIIVVMLFLWAMAKRGPKVVLETERRSGHRA
ncbi:uncharacterized protein BXZ73DRAFT_80643 [Epithele typhae]|uniref:uncharacterized protein n=1 Tax=Epithele typhae TaxID=378194 RepID=UPI0020072237|nr:uncharacterized protein BXZ73DRAFT_80643 [Epithele typhae]KAH9918176.1 hypothetical protein BXZ73DRAFT_80643 [Epithele typhae]